MEEECILNERQPIRDSVRTLKKYGSTCNHVRNIEVTIKHSIVESDTLQGIALKYGVTTEQLRRTNRLFTSDSLFLRQYLLIPVARDSPFYPKDGRPQSLPTRTFSVIESNSNASNTHSNSKSMDSIVINSEEENKKVIDEFLNKIDSTIAHSKKYVIKKQSTEEESSVKNRNLNDIKSGSYQHYSNNHDPKYHGTESYQMHTITQGKRIRKGLERLEKEQDEFFEL